MNNEKETPISRHYVVCKINKLILLKMYTVQIWKFCKLYLCSSA